MIKYFLALASLIFYAVLLPAQSKGDYDFFMSKSGTNAVLFRGSAPLVYSFKYTGTYFAYSPFYERGELRYNGKDYHNLEINLNSHQEEVYVRFNGSSIVVTLNNDFVEHFNIGNKYFINFTGDDKPGSPDPGYYQVLYRGNDKLYKKIKKTYNESVPQVYTGMAANTLERSFKTSVAHYLLKGNVYYVIKNKASLVNIYKNEKRDIGRFIRESNLNFYEFKDEAYVAIMNFVESGKR